VLIADDYSTAYNGIPDWWKVQHGLPLDDWWIWMDDDDGDGFNTAQEYARGSDPNHNDEFGLSFSQVIIPCRKHGFDTYVQTTPPRRYSRQTEKWWDYQPGSLNLAAGENATVIDRVTGEPTTTGDQLPPNTFLGWSCWPAPTPTATVRLGPVDVRQWAWVGGDPESYWPPQFEEWSDGSVSARGELFDEYTTDAFWATSCVALAAAPGVGGWAEAGWGEDVAGAVLVNGELAIRVEKAELKFNLDTARGEMDLAWVEVFTPKDQPENKVYSVRTWSVPGAQKEAVTNLNPLTYGLRVEGRYAIAIPSASLTQVQGLRTPAVGEFTPLTDPHADGRVFIDTTEEWAGTLLQPAQFDRQRVRLTATVDLMGIPPERCRIRWAVYDPDDPATNTWADTNEAYGGDNTGLAHEGGSHWFTSAQDAVVARGGAVPEADRTLGVLLATCDTALTVPSSGDVESTVILNLSDDGGDNFRVRAFAVFDDVAMIGGTSGGMTDDTSGTWTMWRKRVLVVDAMKTLDGLSTHYPADEQSLGYVQQIMHRAYANANPEHACYLDIAAVNGNLSMTVAGALDVYSTQSPNAFQWNNYLYDELHSASATHQDCEFHTIGAKAASVNNMISYEPCAMGGWCSSILRGKQPGIY
jgi:hypothetical protein